MGKTILELHGLQVSFALHGGRAEAVRGMDLAVADGEVLGLVGESGSGKSVTMKAVLGILPGNARIGEGEIRFCGKDLRRMGEREQCRLRGSEISMVFQDPMSSLDPLRKIGADLSEILLRHRTVPKAQVREASLELLRSVGIPLPEKRLEQYPHELSGGMMQRVLIAMALACKPKLLIADEPTTALDVTVQAQILALLKQLQNRYRMSIILITHNLGIVASMCDRVAVMYGGMLMEEGTADEIFYSPGHPYTKALLASIPSVGSGPRERLKPIRGMAPSVLRAGAGCPFADRCDRALPCCHTQLPPRRWYSPTHSALCFLETRDDSERNENAGPSDRGPQS